jgi:CheY-like chemotaxis protein
MYKLLIVEDVELNIELLLQLLEDDYEVLTAENGQSGVDLARQARPDLILMDMSLPVLDGWQATAAIRADPDLEAVIILGLSAHAMESDRQKALDAGCNDYLTKPVDEDLLFAKLDEFLPKP